jgi:transposase
MSHRAVAGNLQISAGKVGTLMTRAQALGLDDWDKLQSLSDQELEDRLFGATPAPGTQRPVPHWPLLHLELRKPAVTLELLHLEYLEGFPQGYKYSQFCALYRLWLKQRGPVMRQEHLAGDKLFVDYAGQKPHYIDEQTGALIQMELFVAVLGASNYTFAQASPSQQGPHFIASHADAFAFFGGVPRLVVPDQLRSGVSTPCRYEPGLQRTYQEMARHYGTVVAPARPAHPRDKAKVEVGVLVAERWILARLRNLQLFGESALHEQIAQLLEDLNGRQMRVYRASRRELFERLDQPALRPLPPHRFVFAQWKLARVNIDYHVEFEGHYYSVPHSLGGEQVELRVTATTLEAYDRGQRVATHLRSASRGHHTTVAEHMPKAHQQHLKWTPSRLINWAGTIGPQTQHLVQAILEERPHPEQGYRSCLGLLRLGKRYTEARLENACGRALVGGARSYQHVQSILKSGLDAVPLSPDSSDPAPAGPDHSNVRGRSYYH